MPRPEIGCHHEIQADGYRDDQSGSSERPTRVHTWAPKGQTPIIQFHFNWTHVSVIAGLTRTNCLFQLHKGSIKKEEIVEFLKALKAHPKQSLLVLCEGLKAHRGRLVRDDLDSPGGRRWPAWRWWAIT